ncbi:MAG: efflux RND transporter periplasmic adaptor subunit [Proteobacteria bacterium]|nr:efflux RND transporter periplasmic adaptor subunit [Pseudomonadota bacterium]MBS0598857.1 efflux RND transporter periplasmic adaptor subunit [Pseudomonadota bacterium]
MTRISFVRACAALVVPLLVVACSHGPSDAGSPASAASPEADVAGTVRLDAHDVKTAGIHVAKLEPHALGEAVRAPGEVVDDAYGTTLITPRVQAIVVRRHARLGDDVAAGTPLVTLSSVEVAEAQAQLEIAEQEWQRMQSLGRDAVSGRRYAEARIAVERARAAARAYSLPGTAHGRADGEFTLTAPHAGRITEDHFVVGERVEPGKAVFRLVDESVVWVDATLPSDQVGRIAVGSPVEVVAGGTKLPGKVVQRAHRTSEGTRTALLRIEVGNRSDRLHGGDYVDVYLSAGADARPQLAVPTAAVTQLHGESVVFLQSAEGVFAPVPIRTGAVIGDQTLVSEGLKAGDAVVVEGVYALKAQILKSQLGEE